MVVNQLDRMYAVFWYEMCFKFLLSQRVMKVIQFFLFRFYRLEILTFLRLELWTFRFTVHMLRCLVIAVWLVDRLLFMRNQLSSTTVPTSMEFQLCHQMQIQSLTKQRKWLSVMQLHAVSLQLNKTNKLLFALDHITLSFHFNWEIIKYYFLLQVHGK